MVEKPHQQKHSGASSLRAELRAETPKADKNSHVRQTISRVLEVFEGVRSWKNGRGSTAAALALCLLPPLKIEKMMSKGKIPKHCHLLGCVDQPL